jgi:hypothetical protein
MVPKPGTPAKRDFYRKWLKVSQSRRYACGKVFWPSDLKSHFDWKIAGKKGKEPVVDWNRWS